jgi:hypothetical protein
MSLTMDYFELKDDLLATRRFLSASKTCQLGFSRNNLAEVLGGCRGADALAQADAVQFGPAVQEACPFLRAKLSRNG